MEEALFVGIRQGCYLLLFPLVFLSGMIPVASFDLKLHPHRLDWVLEGTSLEFTCSFKNRNRPETIVWKNDSRTIGRVVFGNACAVLKLDPEINITCDASSSKLRILQVRTQNRWNLHCQTDNGTARSRSVTVKVLRKSKLILSPMTDPLFKEEGSSATISCRVEGQGHYTLAYPSFTWFKDGLPVVHTTYRATGQCLNGTVVTPPDNVITSCGTYYSRVDIKNISLDDAGTWHCGYGPPRFGMTSKPITIIVEKTGTTTIQDLPTKWTSTSTSDAPTMSSERFIISSISESTSPTSTFTSPMINLGMTTNNTVRSSTTSLTTATVASTQSLSSTSPPTTKTTSTILPTSKPFPTTTFLPHSTTSTLSSTTLPPATSIPTTRSTQTLTETSTTSTKTTTTTTSTQTPTSKQTSMRTSTASYTTTLTTKSTLLPISMTPTTSPSTPLTTFLLTSLAEMTTTHHDASSKIHKPTGHSFTTAVTASIGTEITTLNLTGSEVTGNNGSARGEEVVLEGGTHISPILIGCIIAAVVAIVIFVVIVVIIRRRRNQIVPVEENTFDVRVDISTQTSEDGMDTMT